MSLTALYPKTARIKNRRFIVRRRKVSRKRDLTRTACTILSCMGICLAAASIVLAAMIVYKKMLQCPYLMVKKIAVAGCVRHRPDQIIAMAGINHEINLLAINLKSMCRQLEQSPWIERAQVTRTFPDKLTISICERKPVALINIDQLYLVDEKGTIFTRAEGEDRLALPILTGMSREDVMSRKQAITPLINQALTLMHNLEQEGIALSTVSEIHLDPILGLTLFTTPGAVQIEMGFTPFETKCKRLCAVVEDLKKRNLVPHIIDLTYRHKAFIKLSPDNPNHKSIRSGGEKPWEKMEI